MNISRISIRNPVPIHLGVLAVLVLGTVALFKIPQELFPPISLNWVFISVAYPGVSPEDIEQLVTIPIEDEVADLDHIDFISSTSSEGMGMVGVKFETIDDDEFQRVLLNLKSEVDKADLPEDAEDPVINDFNTSDFMPVVSVMVSGSLAEKEMLDWAEDLREDLLNIRDVSQAEMGGVREREIWVEADPMRLDAYKLSLAHLMTAIASHNRNIPGGTVDMGRSEFIVRTIGEFTDPKEISDVIVRSGQPGGIVRVKDVAVVKDTFEKARTTSRLNGTNAISLSISKKESASTIDVVNQISDVLEEYRSRRLPPGMDITLTNDTTVYVRDMLGILKSNALFGSLFVLLIMYILMGWRNALFAGLGIPLAFFMTIFFMYATGASLNGNAMFGLILVLGMLVDDAIIIIENCHRYLQKGYTAYQAAIAGTREVAAPVLSAVGTTIAAFLPLMLVPGIMGKFLRIIPVVVCLALIASIIESFTSLPVHIAQWSKPPKESSGFQGINILRLKRQYFKIISYFLRRRYIAFFTVGAIIFLLLAVVTLSALGIVTIIPVDLFGGGEELLQFSVHVTAPEGTTLDETDRIVRQIEGEAMKLPPEEIKSVTGNAGMMITDTDWFFKSNYGQVVVDVVRESERERSVIQIMDDLRGRLHDISGVNTLELVQLQNGPPTGKPVEVKIKGENFGRLEEIAELLKGQLASMEGIFDIKDDFNPGKKELKIYVDQEKAALLGLNNYIVASAVRNAFDGGLASVFREADEEIDIIVKYAASYREDVKNIENMKIQAPGGALIPFKDIAKISVEEGYADIRRYKRERTITVSADIDQTVTSTVEANAALGKAFSDIATRYPGYSLDFSGEFEEFKEAFSNIGILFAFGILLMYLILGTQFHSFLQPVIIMFTIPLGFMGAMFGLLITGGTFTIGTMYGVVALSGVVVNDAIVLISFINDARARGVSRFRSIIEGGSKRLRPIILTSVTTIAGLLPTSLGLGGQSKMWIPFANVMIFGLGVATVMTLFIIPGLYAIIDDLKLKFLGTSGLQFKDIGKELDFEEAELAQLAGNGDNRTIS